MSVTDPTGYSRARPFGVALFGFIVMNAIVPGSGFAAWQTALTYAAQGAVVGAVASGNARGAAWGALSAVAFWGVGQAVPGLEGVKLGTAIRSGQQWSHIAAHAFTGGVLTHLQGGDFGHGFFTAGVNAAISPAYSTAGGAGQGGRAIRIAIAAMVGGSLSYANGGNFGQGAIIGAMQQAFNHDGEHGESSDGDSLYDIAVEKAGELFDPVLFPAIDASKEAANNAAQYWADKATSTNNPFYHVPGYLASTWTDGYAGRTALTLVPFGGGTGAHAARPFWQYVPRGNAAYASKWLTRGWGWKPPYALGSQATARLALPPYNPATAVIAYYPPWYKFIWGPRIVAPQIERFGPHAVGGGVEYSMVPFR
jgi:hypothetical protein